MRSTNLARRSVRLSGGAVLAFVDAHNARRAPFIWTKAADEILDKMRRFGLRTQQVFGS